MGILADFIKRADQDERDPWLSRFIGAYIQCMLWSSTDYSDEHGDEPLDRNYNGQPGEFGPGVYDYIVAECTYFYKDNEDLIGNHVERAGHCFWLSRNGHGAGFFDSEQWPKNVRDELQKHAKQYGEQDIYVGDDGLLYIGSMNQYRYPMPWQPKPVAPDQPEGDSSDIVMG